MECSSLISSNGWQVKNKDVTQSGVPEKFGAKTAKFKKGYFFGQKSQILALKKIFTKKINKDQN